MRYRVIKSCAWFKEWDVFDGSDALWKVLNLCNTEWFEEVKVQEEEPNPNFRIGDKVCVDLRWYDKSKEWKYLNFIIASDLSVDNWQITEINWYWINAIRLATPEEIEKYFI